MTGACSPHLHITVALRSEARPLVRVFGLTPVAQARSFPVWGSADVRLVVTGVGRERAAAGAAFLQGLGGDLTERAWLNVGIAGHPTLAVGEVRAADRIDSLGGGALAPRSFYPSGILGSPVPTARVITVSDVEEDYPDDALYEMEAAAFWQTVQRFTTADLIQVVKVVSDNKTESVYALDARRIEELIVGSCPLIQEIAVRLLELVSEIAPQLPSPDRMATRLGFERASVTSKRQLARLLQRAHALGLGEGEVLEAARSSRGGTRPVLEALEQLLESRTQTLYASELGAPPDVPKGGA